MSGLNLRINDDQVVIIKSTHDIILYGRVDRLGFCMRGRDVRRFWPVC